MSGVPIYADSVPDQYSLQYHQEAQTRERCTAGFD